jgi:hypothetical protein
MPFMLPRRLGTALAARIVLRTERLGQDAGKNYGRRTLLLVGLLLVPLSQAWTQDGDKSRAEAVAASFLQKMDAGDLGTLYDTLSTRFQSATPKNSFVQGAGLLRIQSGGSPAATRRLIGSQALDQIPGTTISGHFYYVRYLGKYAVFSAFQDVYLEKQGSDWKVGGFQFGNAPPQAQ